MKTVQIHPTAIEICDRQRARLDEGAVLRLMESMTAIGLRTPIAVRIIEEQDWNQRAVLVAGRHRLEAACRLDWDGIDCVEVNDETDARLWEISENLAWAELTALERDEHIAEWVRLTELQSRQPDAIESKRADGRGHRPESGVSKAARGIGVSEPDARRAKKVSGLSDDAKTAAREVGLDDNRTALLKLRPSRRNSRKRRSAIMRRRVPSRRHRSRPFAC